MASVEDDSVAVLASSLVDFCFALTLRPIRLLTVFAVSLALLGFGMLPPRNLK